MTSIPRQVLDSDLDTASPAQRDRVRLFRLLVALGAALRGRMDRALDGSGVTTQQAMLLSLAAGVRPAPSQGALAQLMGVSHQNVKQIALALERKGLLEFHDHPADRRVRRLVPTARARRLFARRNAADFERIAGWFEALNDQNVQALVNGLLQVAAVLDRSSGDPDQSVNRP